MPYPLETPRLSIRPLSAQDLDSFVSYRQDPAVARFQSWETTYSKQQGLDLLRGQLGVEVPKVSDWLQLAAIDKQSGALLGDVAIHNVSGTCFELGFTISPLHQGRGIAKEAVARVIKFLTEEVGVRELIASTDSRNEPSKRLLNALGFSNQASKGWQEEFKGEAVSVDYFNLIPAAPTHPRQQPQDC